MFRFLHAADLHLDSPLKGLQRYDGAPVERIRSASRRALENLVQLALDRQVQVVLIAGDVYDGDWKDHNTGLFFISQLARLIDVGIRVVLIRGNHDAANRMTRSLRLPPGAHLLGEDSPESLIWEDLGVAIHGQSFADAAETRNLVTGYPAAVRGLFNIGLLHTSLTGGDGHDNYAPCTPDDLRLMAYDYWALGHIHRRDDTTFRDPAIIFPGNLQGRHARETGPKGCLIGEVDATELRSLEFCPVDVFRWETLTVDLTASDDPDEMLQRVDRAMADALAVHSPLPLALRVELVGPCDYHRQLAAQQEQWAEEVRNCGIQTDAERLWIEKVRFQTREPGRSVWENLQDGPLAELWEELDHLRGDDEAWGQIVAGLELLEKKLPLEQRGRLARLRLDHGDVRAELLEQVQALLAGRLSGATTSS